jgi:hypothetical protein
MHIRDRQFIMVTARNMRNKDNTHFSLTRSRDTRGVYRLSQSNTELEGGRWHPSMASIVLSDLYLVDGFNARQPRLMATSERWLRSLHAVSYARSCGCSGEGTPPTWLERWLLTETIAHKSRLGGLSPSSSLWNRSDTSNTRQ